jgi:hypothetical protein
MTSETKTTIGPEDILAIELGCVKCNARVTRRVDNYIGDPPNCPNCGERWSHFAQAFGELNRLVMVLKMFADRPRNGDFPFRAKFELVEPKKTTP